MFRLGAGVFGSHCQRCLQKASTDVAYYNKIKTRALLPLPKVQQCSSPTQVMRCFYSSLRHPTTTQRLAQRTLLQHQSVGRVRYASSSLVVRVVGRLLRLRYLVFTSAVGGGVALSQRYEQWKENLPDMGWLRRYIPDEEQRRGILQQFSAIANKLSLPEIPIARKSWWDRVPDRIQGAKDWFNDLAENDPSIFTEVPEPGSSVVVGAQPLNLLGRATSSGSDESKKDQDKLTELQQEFMQVQVRYQKELDRLEKENRELKRQSLMRQQKQGKRRKMKKSLIDLYSEVLDELADYDSSYNTQDHLPRVVVVGDQSSGKTSVLEMIAQARIFPRGSGEMMTRSPVKVTLSEGPYHIAKFKDSTKEFDLTKETELEALRREIEIRMKASVSKGQTVSSDAISLTVKGPGIQRMVLVDLPGIISTVTTGMAGDTKDRIAKMCKQYMENPNAIILCIQDGSLDAERSNVTDIVSSMDPGGKRTIFVLTKVDLAESNLLNPQRIKKILEGRLFPMKALGYFAVVTGKGNTEDTIRTIKDYEEKFFRSSRLFKDGVLKPTQMTTANLSLAVSEVFWKMVRESVEQQADAFKATRFNLETEWKNTFPKLRELDKDELFEKARGEILDEIINLSQVTPQQWEDAFNKKLWDKVATHVFESIYLPAAQSDDPGVFNTTIDIKLKHWADKQLPKKCVEVGVETLEEEFSQMLEKDKVKKGHDPLFDSLKAAVKDDSFRKHEWDEKAEQSLRVMQVNTLEDRSVPDKQQWDSALKFMELALKNRQAQTEESMKEMKGPGTWEQWTSWKSRSETQKQRSATFQELEKLLATRQQHKPTLGIDEITTVRKNLETQSVFVENSFISETWHQLYRQQFFKRGQQKCSECKKGFYYYKQGFTDSGLDCHDVVLFWRIQRMLNVTSNALRQQVMNNEARRLERNIKDALEEFCDDRSRLDQLLTGRRVQLAEELKKVRQIQELLEEFIQNLNKEK